MTGLAALLTQAGMDIPFRMVLEYEPLRLRAHDRFNVTVDDLPCSSIGDGYALLWEYRQLVCNDAQASDATIEISSNRCRNILDARCVKGVRDAWRDGYFIARIVLPRGNVIVEAPEWDDELISQLQNVRAIARRIRERRWRRQ